MTTQQTQTIADFVLARIAEGEAVASKAAFGWGSEWQTVMDDDWAAVHSPGKRLMVGCEDGDVITHIAANDPARVLAQCAAHRAIVEEHSGKFDDCLRSAPGFGDTDCHTLRALAAIWSDSPEYRSEWAL